MKLLFLDHDGVMCTEKEWGLRFKDDNLLFDPFNKHCVRILNALLKTDNNIEIIISSDWRKYCSLYVMREYYESQGVIKLPIGYTDDLMFNRALEIKKYLELQKNITGWCSIDDLDLSRELKQHFVHITDKKGLQEQDINRIIKSINI